MIPCVSCVSFSEASILRVLNDNIQFTCVEFANKGATARAIRMTSIFQKHTHTNTRNTSHVWKINSIDMNSIMSGAIERKVELS